MSLKLKFLVLFTNPNKFSTQNNSSIFVTASYTSHPIRQPTGLFLKLWTKLKLTQPIGPNPIKKDRFKGYLQRLFQLLHPKSSCEIILPYHEKKSQPAMSVWKSLPLHQSRVWIFRQANRVEFPHTIRIFSPI